MLLKNNTAIKDYKIIKKIGEGRPVHRSTYCKSGDKK